MLSERLQMLGPLPFKQLAPAVAEQCVPLLPRLLCAGFTSEQRELLGPLLKRLSNKLQVGGP